MNVQAAMRPLPLALLLLAACNAPPAPEFPTEGVATAESTHLWESTPTDRRSMAQQVADQPPLALTHGALSRARGHELQTRLDLLYGVVQPEVERLQADLARALDALQRPERLATTDPVLRTWRSARREAYQSAVALFHDEAARRLEGLRDATLAQAADIARQLATERGPMDAGPTGDPALDEVLHTFSEVIEGAVDLNELSVQRSQNLERRVDLFEAFSSFGRAEEAQMGGRLHLFVGGDETDGVPRALLAFRVDDGRDPSTLRFTQALRHRILRGSTVVQDLGWRAAPQVGGGRAGHPQTEVLDNVLIAPQVEPVIDRSAPAYGQLRDMRIQCDVQSVVHDGERVLGGVDWRVEFQVSARGDLTWQLAGGRPVFDPHGVEAGRVVAP